MNGTSGQEYIETAAGHVFAAGDLVTVPASPASRTATTSSSPSRTASASNQRRFCVADDHGARPPGHRPRGRHGHRPANEPVADSPLGTPDGNGVYPTKNYTIIQTKGTQGDNNTFLLYASDVITAGFGPTEGDYFRRTVPWNLTTGTTDEAPNGRPTETSGAGAGDVAFNVQMTSWCTTCHTRYFGYQNPNPTGTEPGTSTQAVKNDHRYHRQCDHGAAHGYAVGDCLGTLLV